MIPKLWWIYVLLAKLFTLHNLCLACVLSFIHFYQLLLLYIITCSTKEATTHRTNKASKLLSSITYHTRTSISRAIITNKLMLNSATALELNFSESLNHRLCVLARREQGICIFRCNSHPLTRPIQVQIGLFKRMHNGAGDRRNTLS